MRVVTHSDDPGAAAAYWSEQMKRSPLPRHMDVAPSAQQIELESSIRFLGEQIRDLAQLVKHADPSTLHRGRLNLALDDFRDDLTLGLQAASALQLVAFRVAK